LPGHIPELPRERRFPYVSPLLADIKPPMPDTLILSAGRDGLRSDGVDYGKKLAEADVAVRCVVYTNAFHAFINNIGKSEIADDAAGEILEFLRP
jgi:acetyl esterase